ncbi:MAG: DUF4097 domain-containing protein [Oscillospiraceae bacterium]|nr:DUF4097 domain-containing protein [Oscillospiraceae bacterium]
MKRILKVWWKIALTMIAAGVALMVLGFTLGARGGYAYINSGRLQFSSAGTYYTIEESNLPPFDIVEVKVRSANIEIVQSDHYGLEMRLPEHEDEPQWGVTGGKLTIDASKADNIFSFLNFGFHQSSYIKVYCPSSNASSASGFSSNKLQSVDLTAGSGDISLQGISADRIGINTSSGLVRINTPYYQSVVAHATSGDITFSGAGDNASLTLSSISGSIKADASGCGAVDVETKSGDITILGETSADMEMRVMVSSGRIDINTASWKSLTAQAASGDIKITGDPHGTTSATAGSGDITMRLSGTASDFSYDISTGSGFIRFGENRIGSPARNINSAAINTLSIRTSSGNVRVDFDR